MDQLEHLYTNFAPILLLLIYIYSSLLLILILTDVIIALVDKLLLEHKGLCYSFKWCCTCGIEKLHIADHFRIWLIFAII